MIEKSTVELLDIFIDLVKIEPEDENGQRRFRLPRNEVDEHNWRLEFELPIDKYDWLRFDTIFQQVYQYPETKREQLRMYKLPSNRINLF